MTKHCSRSRTTDTDLDEVRASHQRLALEIEALHALVKACSERVRVLEEGDARAQRDELLGTRRARRTAARLFKIAEAIAFRVSMGSEPGASMAPHWIELEALSDAHRRSTPEKDAPSFEARLAELEIALGV